MKLVEFGNELPGMVIICKTYLLKMKVNTRLRKM